MELEYDRFSRLTSWKWGDLTESYGFDRAGRLSEIRYGDGSAMIYAFKDMFSSLVSEHVLVWDRYVVTVILHLHETCHIYFCSHTV